MAELILGIGNVLEADDGIGVYVVEKINEHLSEISGSERVKATGEWEVTAINCAMTPENYTSVVRKHSPDRLILVDAADMGLSPGSYRLIPPEKIGVMCISTHNMPLSLFASYVGGYCGDIAFVGIQPERIDFGIALSGVVKKGGDEVARLIVERRLGEIEML